MVPDTVTSTPASTRKIPSSCPCAESRASARIVEKVLAEQQAGDPGARIDEHAERDHSLDQRLRRDPLRRIEAERDRKKDDHSGGDDTGLKAAARPIVAVELHIEGEQQNERQDELGADAKDEIEAHSPLSLSCALAAASRADSSMTPIPAVKITVVSPSVS